MSINRRMDKKAVVHTHNGISLSQRKDGIWLSSDEVHEPRAYYMGEVNQKERDKYHTLAHTCIWSLGRRCWRAVCRAANEAQRTDLRTRRGKGRWGCLRKQRWSMCLTTCNTDSQCERALWCRELRSGALWQLEVWDAVGGGREVQGGHMYT